MSSTAGSCAVCLTAWQARKRAEQEQLEQQYYPQHQQQKQQPQQPVSRSEKAFYPKTPQQHAAASKPSVVEEVSDHPSSDRGGREGEADTPSAEQLSAQRGMEAGSGSGGRAGSGSGSRAGSGSGGKAGSMFEQGMRILSDMSKEEAKGRAPANQRKPSAGASSHSLDAREKASPAVVNPFAKPEGKGKERVGGADGVPAFLQSIKGAAPAQKPGVKTKK